MKQCATGKVSYQTKHQARHSALQIKKRIRKSHSKRGFWERDPYQCTICGNWHLKSSKDIDR